ncbi:MAG: O-antigen ligase family protein [Nitrospirota bacterium]
MIIRLAVLLLATVYLVQGIGQGFFLWIPLRINQPILCYLALALLSAGLSPYKHQTVQWVVVLFTYAALLYLIVFFVTEWDHVVKLLAVVVGIGIMEAALALIQSGWFSALRPTGTFFNPNFLAGYLAAVVTVIVGVLCYARVGMPWVDRAGNLRKELLCASWPARRISYAPLTEILASIAALGLLLSAILWTGSRGAVLGLLVGVSLVAGFRFGRRGLVVLLMIVVTGLVIPNPLRTRVIAEHTMNPVAYTRIHMWKQSARMMVDHPFGVGLGLYQYVYPRYAFPVGDQIARYGKIAQTPHSEYLQMGVELGVASVVVFCWGIATVGQAAASVLRLRLRRWQRGTIAGVTGAAAGILVHAAVDSNLHEPAIAILLTLFVAIILVAERLSRRHEERTKAIAVRPKWVWAVAGFVVITVLAVGFVRLGLAWVAYEAGLRAQAAENMEQAITKYQMAIALDPGKALYHNSLASIYFWIFQKIGDRAAAEAAMDELRAAIERNPVDGRLFALLGFVHTSMASSRLASESPDLRLSWLRIAVRAYERALELEPYSAFDRLELGRLYLALGDRRTAEQRVREAVELEPNFLPGREWLVRLYVKSGRAEDRASALQEYREILDRRQRYNGWAKDALEERYLRANVASLAAQLGQAGMDPS